MDINKIRYLFPKIKNRLFSVRKHLWKHLDIGWLSLRGFRGFSSASQFKERLNVILGKYDNSILQGITEEEKAQILSSAKKALRHEFDLLGSGPTVIDPIDWHIDFKCGARWGKKWYRDIVEIKGADIKVPWELSRCQHLLWLGEAYLLTGDTKYAKEIIDEINWWIADNPLMYTVNWKCAMDVAFRAVNWMFALNMIAKFDGFDDQFTNKVTSSLWQHGFFIRNNLEKVLPESNNHYTSDLTGLLYLGALFDNASKGREWKQYAIKEYILEIKHQVLPSGVHYERSISYHRMMTEMLSYAYYLLQRLGEELPVSVKERISAMYDYIANYTKPNGYSPLISDNDNGRFAPFLERDFRYHNYLNDRWSIENRFVAAGLNPLFGSKKQRTCIYSDAGVAIVRNNKDYLFINNCGYSKNPRAEQTIIGTHTHNDLLSFELSIKGDDVIVDSGTYLYTSSVKERNAFRSTQKHNTIVVDGEEQNGFTQPFYMKRNVYINPLKQRNDIIEGSYRTIEGRLTHTRRFLMKDNLLISDTIIKEGGNHEASLYFHLAQGLKPVIKDGNVEVSINGMRVIVSFDIPPMDLKILEDTLSPSFGKVIPAKTIMASYLFGDEISINTIIGIKS